MTTKEKVLSFVCDYCDLNVIATSQTNMRDLELTHWYECDGIPQDEHVRIFSEDGVLEHYFLHLAGEDVPEIAPVDEIILVEDVEEEVPEPVAPEADPKPETIFLCEYCGKECKSKIGLHSHVTHKHSAETLDMSALIQQAKDAIVEAEQTSEEIEQQSQIDSAMWAEVKELRALVDNLEALRDEHLLLEPEYHDIDKLTKWDNQIIAYNNAIDARCTMAEVQRGRKVYTRVALANQRRDNQVEADKRNREQAGVDSAWVQEETMRYHNLLTGRAWCHTNDPAWDGAMPFIVDFCWRVTNFANKEKEKKSYKNLRESGIYDKAFAFTMKRYGFVEHHTERVRSVHWFVDDDAELDSETFTQEIDTSLPFADWQSELESLDKKYRTFYYKEDALDKTIRWAKKNGLFGSGDHEIVYPSNVKVRKVRREHDTTMGHAIMNASRANNSQRHDPNTEENRIK